MNKWHVQGIWAAAMLIGSASSFATTGIIESTDPARAAQVEQSARDIMARAETLAGEQAKASVVHGNSASGRPFVSGGITVGDRVAMHADRMHYNLWLTSVAKPSGAYVVDATLRIVDTRSQSVVFEHKMEGPWLMISLPAGRYDVLATYNDDGARPPQALRTTVRVPATGQRQVVLRFASDDKVGSEMQSPFGGNPFGESPPRGN